MTSDRYIHRITGVSHEIDNVDEYLRDSSEYYQDCLDRGRPTTSERYWRGMTTHLYNKWPGDYTAEWVSDTRQIKLKFSSESAEIWFRLRYL